MDAKPRLKPALAPLAIVAALALAACDQSPDPAPPATEVELDAAEDGISDALSNLQDAGTSLNDAARAALAAAEGPLAEARASLEAMSGDLQQEIGEQMSALVVDLEARRDASMTDAQKADAVADSRARAEQLARTAGFGDADIVEAGNTAEQAARRVLGYEGPIALQ